MVDFLVSISMFLCVKLCSLKTFLVIKTVKYILSIDSIQLTRVSRYGSGMTVYFLEHKKYWILATIGITSVSDLVVYIYGSTHMRKIAIRVLASPYQYGNPYLCRYFFVTVRVQSHKYNSWCTW